MPKIMQDQIAQLKQLLKNESQSVGSKISGKVVTRSDPKKPVKPPAYVMGAKRG